MLVKKLKTKVARLCSKRKMRKELRSQSKKAEQNLQEEERENYFIAN